MLNPDFKELLQLFNDKHKQASKRLQDQADLEKLR